MSKFNYYKSGKAYGELYLQFPRVLLYSKTYAHLSDSAKIAYIAFRDRLQYSLKNNWIDKDNNVYFLFTNEELCDLLHKSENTVTKIKKELVKVGLLLQKKQGFDPKTKKNKPNKLYLADLEVTAIDIYQLQKTDEMQSNHATANIEVHEELPERPSNQGTANIEVHEVLPERPSNQGTANIEVHEELPERPSNQGTANIEVNLYSTKAFKDFKEFKDQGEDLIFNKMLAHSEKNEDLEKDQTDFYIENNNLVMLYGEELITAFKSYSFNDFNMFLLFTEKLYHSQLSAEKETNKSLDLFEWNKYTEFTQKELLKTFKRCIQQYRYGKTKSFSNFLFISFKNVFLDYSKVV